MFHRCYACPAAPPTCRDPCRRGAAAGRLAGCGYRSPVAGKTPDRQGASAARVAPAPDAVAVDDTPDYLGKRFGLPKDGPMSVAPMGRRVAALVLDSVLVELIGSAAAPR